MRYPIIITQQAWKKMKQVLKDTNQYAFLFSAQGGGCNGFNYSLKTMQEGELTQILGDTNVPPTILTDQGNHLFVDPLSEIMLLGTTIDYIEEDYSKQIYESKFTFTPKKELATSCGCGVSFSPR